MLMLFLFLMLSMLLSDMIMKFSPNLEDERCEYELPCHVLVCHSRTVLVRPYLDRLGSTRSSTGYNNGQDRIVD